VTATAEPRASAADAPPPSALDRAEGVELLGDVHGSGYKDGAALVRRADGQMVQLGPLMYALLECVDGRRSLDELAACMSESLGKGFDAQHIEKLAQKLAAQGLLAGTEQHAPPRRNPLLALRFKVLVTNPRWTKLLTAPFAFLFSPLIVVPVAVGFFVCFWFTLIHKGIASAASESFQKPGLLLLIFLLAVASAGFHELGHAAACRYGGAAPGGMGMGLYMVWPAFYTDVTDSYRLPRGARLRVDLGGIYFNAVVVVITTGVWLAWHVDALLLLVALQFLMIVKNLSPVIRSDGYHILADTTGIPDLYAHLGPTIKRLLPWHRNEPSALKGRARALVTLWVLIVVPVLLSLMMGAVILLPRMLTTAWDSGHVLIAAMPHEGALTIAASCLRLVALVLPVVGSVLIAQRLLRGLVHKAQSWSGGRPVRQVLVVGIATAVAAGAAWAMWPAGQYQAVRPTDGGTLVSFTHLISAPQHVARPATTPPPPPRVALAAGKHLAVAMIPVGGATKAHPAVFFVPATKDNPAVAVISTSAPDPADAPTTSDESSTSSSSDPSTPASTSASTPVQANAFPFKLPSAPGPGDSQAVAVNHQDSGVTYDVVYSLVTVSGSTPVKNINSAFAFANCKACTTVAVSFQVVLVIGQSNTISPINAAGSLNVDCPSCLTTAVADQIVVTLKSQPSQELVQQIQTALQQLNAISSLGANGTPAAIAAQVAAVQTQIDNELAASGQLTNPPASTTTSATATTTSPAATTTAPETTTTTAASTTTSEAQTTPTTTDETTTTTETTTDSTTTTESTTTAPTTTTTAGG
jgi:putative peptide zinc metalloprotease protein